MNTEKKSPATGKTSYLVTGGISQYLYYCNHVAKVPPAQVYYIGNIAQLKRVPVGATVILYGDFHLNPIYDDVDRFQEQGIIKTKVVVAK